MPVNCSLKLIPMGALIWCQFLVRVTSQQVKLPRQQAVHRSVLLRAFDRAQALKPIRRGTETVTAILEQGVLGNNAALNFVKLARSARRHQKRFEQRNQAILIEVRLRVGDGFGEILAEAREILLV